jgi:hypothetical protein
MSSDNSNSTAIAPVSSTEVFALTDEQIVGLGAEETTGEVSGTSAQPSLRAVSSDRPDALGSQVHERSDGRGAQAGVPVPQDAPEWLVERMRDPQHGEEARALWDGKQKADAEVAAYREVFATAADARALKELYPGGLGDAQQAADRARELEAIDAAFYRGDSAFRTQLAQRLLQQDPAAFREMVETGMRLLGSSATLGQAQAVRGAQSPNVREEGIAAAETQRSTEIKDGGLAQPSRELVLAYGEFEKAANADLEKSVGGAISRVMEEALPNLRLAAPTGREGAPAGVSLRDRLTTAVRDEVDSALRSDQALGGQVSRILAGRRFDESSRAQVVRLIDARAQQLIPSAVKRVVSSWTEATLSARSKRDTAATAAVLSSAESTTQRDTKATPRAQRSAAALDAPPVRSRRLDYNRFTDEQILGL